MLLQLSANAGGLEFTCAVRHGARTTLRQRRAEAGSPEMAEVLEEALAALAGGVEPWREPAPYAPVQQAPFVIALENWPEGSVVEVRNSSGDLFAAGPGDPIVCEPDVYDVLVVPPLPWRELAQRVTVTEAPQGA